MEQNGSGLEQGPFCPGGALEKALTCPVQGWGPVVNSVGPLGLTSQSLQMKQGVCTKM